MSLFKKILGSIRFLNKTDGTLRQQTIRSGFWVGTSSIGNNLLSFVRSVVLARILAPEIFGLMAICLVVVRGLELFTETGYSAALIQRQKGFDDAKDTAFTLMVIRGLLLTTIVIFIAPLISSYYEIESLDILVKVIGISFIFNGLLNINIVSHQKDLNFKRLTYFEQIQNITNTVIVITLAYWLRSVWALVIGHVIASITGAFISYLMFNGRPRLKLDMRIAKELFGYGKFITGLTIVVFISIESGTFVLGKIGGMDQLGYYVLAFTLANLPSSQFSRIISKVLFPVYSKLQNDTEVLRALYLKVLKLVSKLAIAAAAGLATLAPEIIQVVYGEKWLPAVDALRVLAVFGAIRAVSSVNGYVFNAIGKPKVTFYVNVVRLLFTLILIYPLTLEYGLIGAAMAVTVAIALEFLLSLVSLLKTLGLQFHVVAKDLLMAVFLSMVMAGVLTVAKTVVVQTNPYTLGMLIMLGALFYTLINFRDLTVLLKRKPHIS